MRTELAEIIGNFYYNEEKGYENIWILKPINMSRSMDMLITDNLKETVKYRIEEFTGMKVKEMNVFVEGVRVID